MGVLAKKVPAGAPAQDPEDTQEPPEQPGEAPDAEDQADGEETDSAGGDAEDAADGGADEGQEGDAESNVSPEEQAIYDTVVIAAEAMIYGKGTRDVIVQKLKAEKGSPQVIGHTAAMIVISIKGGAQKEGKDVPDDVLFAAGQEIVADLVEVAIAAGLVQEKDKEAVYKQAVFEGLKKFGDVEKMTGQMTPQAQQEAKQGLQAMAAQGSKNQPPPSSAGAVGNAMQGG